MQQNETACTVHQKGYMQHMCLQVKVLYGVMLLVVGCDKEEREVHRLATL
jgi:hypothetical protein